MTLFSARTLVLTVALWSVSAGATRAAFEFIPPPASPVPDRALSAPAGRMEGGMMPAAPAAGVVSEALSSASARLSPQSILPPAPAPSSVQGGRMAAPATGAPAMPVINMNPLGLIGPDQGASATPASGPVPAVAPAPYVSATPAAPAGPQAAPASADIYGDAIGFGRELPLALAVSQIIPPDFAFAFERGVNPGDTVSWEGGKPWNQVLQETLADAGAQAHIDPAKKEIKIVMAARSGYMPAAYTQAPDPVLVASPAVSPLPVQAPRAPSAPAMAPMISPAPATISAPVMPPAQPPVQNVAAPAAVPPAMGMAPASAPVMSATLDPKAVNSWEAARGSTLRKILEDWSMRAGVELFWSSDFDFPVESAVRIRGTFEEAVQTLLSGLRDAQPRPIGRLHPNLPDGPPVLVIETKHILQ